MMECPTPCQCGEIIELDEMWTVKDDKLVCEDCYCANCEGSGECSHCGDGECPLCFGQGYN